MLFKTFKTLSIFAVVSSILIPFEAKAGNCSYASYYGSGDGFHGRTTANGERFNAYGRTVAHRWLPFGTRLKVTNQRTGKSVVVRVNDRGPYVGGRTIDMSYGAFASIAPPSQGVAKVCYVEV